MSFALKCQSLMRLVMSVLAIVDAAPVVLLGVVAVLLDELGLLSDELLDGSVVATELLLGVDEVDESVEVDALALGELDEAAVEPVLGVLVLLGVLLLAICELCEPVLVELALGLEFGVLLHVEELGVEDDAVLEELGVEELLPLP